MDKKWNLFIQVVPQCYTCKKFRNMLEKQNVNYMSLSTFENDFKNFKIFDLASPEMFKLSINYL